MTKPVFAIDGRKFDDLDGFYDEVTTVLGLSRWGRNLDAFNDILRGGFGTPDGGFVLRWLHANRSRAALGSKFDVLLEIIRVHGPGGEEHGDGVELELR